jgi:hypothetical protein
MPPQRGADPVRANFDRRNSAFVHLLQTCGITRDGSETPKDGSIVDLDLHHAAARAPQPQTAAHRPASPQPDAAATPQRSNESANSRTTVS